MTEEYWANYKRNKDKKQSNPFFINVNWQSHYGVVSRESEEGVDKG